jgi:hypothetical protein
VAILVRCECGQEFQTNDANAGRRARCPDCGRELIVPKPVEFPGDDFAGLQPVKGGTSGKAIASLVLGLLSLVCMVFTGIPAIILGCLGLSEINRSRGLLRGSGMAISGIVLGCLGSTLVMVALLLPAVQAAREAARRAQCVNNLKQIALAMHNYHDAEGRFPAAALTGDSGQPLLSWRVALLPYLGEQGLYAQFHLDEPWDSPHNRAVASRMPTVFACPSEPPGGGGTTTYQVVVGPATMFTGSPEGVRISDITDGTSNTIMVVESATPVPWTAPQDLSAASPTPLAGCGSKHPQGFNTALADGSVRFIKTSISPATFHNLLTRAGGEVISASSY